MDSMGAAQLVEPSILCVSFSRQQLQFQCRSHSVSLCLTTECSQKSFGNTFPEPSKAESAERTEPPGGWREGLRKAEEGGGRRWGGGGGPCLIFIIPVMIF